MHEQLTVDPTAAMSSWHHHATRTTSHELDEKTLNWNCKPAVVNECHWGANLNANCCSTECNTTVHWIDDIIYRSWRKKIGTRFCTTECRRRRRGQRCTSSFSWLSATTSSSTSSLPFLSRASRPTLVYYNIIAFSVYLYGQLLVPLAFLSNGTLSTFIFHVVFM